MNNEGWQWYAGSDEEHYNIGPCDTRDEALEQAVDEQCGEFKDDDGAWKLSIFLIEARNDALRLADFIDVERMLERADEAVGESERGSEYDNPPYFDITPQQDADLTECIKRVCDAWQAEHKIWPKTYTFSASRNAEHVIVPRLQEETTA